MERHRFRTIDDVTRSPEQAQISSRARLLLGLKIATPLSLVHSVETQSGAKGIALGLGSASIQEVLYALETGYFPGKNIYFSPNISFSPNIAVGKSLPSPSRDFPSPGEARQEATHYAAFQAKHHAFLISLGFTLPTPEISIMAADVLGDYDGMQRSLNAEKQQEILERRAELAKLASISPTDLFLKITQAQTYKGFLIALSPAIIDDFPILQGEKQDRQLRVQTDGTGLPLMYVVGIEPIGNRETEFMEQGLTQIAMAA